MTAPFELDIEEDRFIPLDRSHLAEGRCGCGNTALYARGRRPRCGTCLRSDADKVTAPGTPPLALVPLGQGHLPMPVEESAPFPAPEVTSRDCWDRCDAPAVVGKLAQAAGEAGWRVKVQRSRGCFPHGSTGRPSAPRDLFAVIMNNELYSAYAIRDGDTWSSVMLWGHDRTWFPLANFTELGQYIAAGGDMPEAWFAGVRQRLADAEVRDKFRKDCDKGLHRGQYLNAVPFLGPWRDETAGWWCRLCRHGWRSGAEVWKKPKKGKTEAL